MKKILFFSVLILLAFNVQSQEWLKNLPKNKSSKNYNFFDYQKAFYSFWKPYNVKGGYYIKNGVKKKAEGWKQFKRWEYEMEYEIDPKTGDFPKLTAQEVYNNFLKNRKQKLNVANDANWTSLGPNSSAGGYAGVGRINCIAFDPDDNNTFWIGAPAGGLWKTSDNGKTWTCLTDNNGVLGVSDILIPSDYSSSKTIYIATGDKDHWDNCSIGVLKSTDGGNTWNATGLSFNLSDYEMVNRLLLDPSDNNTIIAATNAGVYKTTNGGANWTQISTENFIDMEYKPGDFNTLYGGDKYGYIYVSSDGGQNWTKSNDLGSRVELAVTPANPKVVYALVANSDGGLVGIYKSTDSGNSFSEVYDGTIDNHNILSTYNDASGSSGQGWYDLSLAVSPTDENTVIVGGVNTWRSTDGGKTFSLIAYWTGLNGVQTVHADKHQLKYRSDGKLFECNDGGLYVSDSNGDNYVNISNGIVNSQMYKLGVSQTVQNEVITGLQDNGTKLLYNNSWHDVKGGDGMECIIDYTNDSIQYATYTNGQITRTKDLWNTRKDIQPAGYPGAWVTPYILSPIDHNTIYAGYADVWETNDNGDNWTKISNINFSDKIRSMAISSDGTTLYVADLSHIWKTTDDGKNWTDITGTLPVNSSSITYICVKDKDPNTIWVSTSGYSSPGVYESTDGGQNWTNISSGLPKIPVRSIIQNKQSTGQLQLYAGTDLGVYIKKGNNDWASFNNGLPNVRIGELEIYYNSNQQQSKLYAATYGRGLWTSPVENPVTDIPIVSTNTPTNITKNSVVSGGKIISSGSSSITEKGIVWSENTMPTISDNKITYSGTDNDYAITITGLNSGTTYHIRAYAKNNSGVSYGEDRKFSTLCDTSNIPIIQKFTQASFPNCWSVQTQGTTTNSWTISNTNKAGGNANELLLKWINVNPATTRFISPAINTTGINTLYLSFKTYYDDYGTGATIKIQSSTDKTNWTDENWNFASGNGDINATTINTTISHNLNNKSTYIAFTVTGDLSAFDAWYIDNIKISNETNINSISASINIYPNPVKDNKFYISIANSKNNYSYKIYNDIGKIVSSGKLHKNFNAISTVGLKTGVYILDISNSEEKITKKLIIE